MPIDLTRFAPVTVPTELEMDSALVMLTAHPDSVMVSLGFHFGPWTSESAWQYVSGYLLTKALYAQDNHIAFPSMFSVARGPGEPIFYFRVLSDAKEVA